MSSPARQRADLDKLVSAARALLANQVSFPIGCLRMSKVLTWLDDSEISYPVFRAYLSDAQALPLGSERLLCERSAFFRFDERLETLNAEYRREVLQSCFDILDRYGDVSTSDASTDESG